MNISGGIVVLPSSAEKVKIAIMANFIFTHHTQVCNEKAEINSIIMRNSCGKYIYG